MEEERDHERFLGHIAHRLAGTNPVEAERVIRMMRDQWPYFRDAYTQRVCYRMVTVDPERAKNLARAFMTNYRYKARALGAMALALARTGKDRAEAVAMLAEAYEMLQQVASGKDDQWDGLSMACTARPDCCRSWSKSTRVSCAKTFGGTLAMRPPWRGGDSRDGIPADRGIAGCRDGGTLRSRRRPPDPGRVGRDRAGEARLRSRR